MGSPYSGEELRTSARVPAARTFLGEVMVEDNLILSRPTLHARLKSVATEEPSFLPTDRLRPGKSEALMGLYLPGH